MARSSDAVRLRELIGEVKVLAREYYLLTGRPLGVTGEIAEYEAARILGLKLAPVDKGDMTPSARHATGASSCRSRVAVFLAVAAPSASVRSI